MNITKQDIDALNAELKIEINKDDYQPKVEKILKDYKSKANVPGFRKGHVPMGMIKKQYEKSVIIDEVNKLIQEALNKYLSEEKLDILGNPLPKIDENFSWEKEDFVFDFELGMAPKFTVDLDTKNKISLNKIVADKDFIDGEVTNIRKQYGKMLTQDEVTEESRVAGTFTFEYKRENKEQKSTIDLDQIKGKTNLKKFIGKKVGDTLQLKTKNLFKDDHDLMHALNIDHDDAHNFDTEVKFEISEINKLELSELNQDFFDKIFGEGVVKSEKEMRNKIKETAEVQFQVQADQKFLNDATEYLIENTKFDLPAEFLKKWLKTGTEKELTDEEAKAEYERSEKGLRYQLIESHLAKQHNLQYTYEEIREHASKVVISQFAQYGQPAPAEDQLKLFVDNIMGNQEEVKRLGEQIMGEKLVNFYKENLKYKEKEVSYKDFVEETYK